MRRGVELLDRPSGGSGAHICWSFDEPADFRAAASEFAAEGLDRGERVLYLADAPADELPGHLVDLDVDKLLGAGHLGVHPVRDVYGHDGGFDGRAQVRAFRELADEALADGYTRLRVVADTSVLATDDPEPYLAYELLVDRFMADAEVVGMCGFAASTPGLVDFFAVHPTRSAAGPDPAAGAWFDRKMLHLTGELDVTTARVVDSVITALLAGDGDERLDWSDLAFVDARSLARFDGLIFRLCEQGRHLRVRGAPAIVRRCCEILGLHRLMSAMEDA